MQRKANYLGEYNLHDKRLIQYSNLIVQYAFCIFTLHLKMHFNQN